MGGACFLSCACLYLRARQFSDDPSYECFIQEPKCELVWWERAWEHGGMVESCMLTRSSVTGGREEERTKRYRSSQSTDYYLDLRFSTVWLLYSLSLCHLLTISLALCPTHVHTAAFVGTLLDLLHSTAPNHHNYKPNTNPYLILKSRFLPSKIPLKFVLSSQTC